MTSDHRHFLRSDWFLDMHLTVITPFPSWAALTSHMKTSSSQAVLTCSQKYLDVERERVDSVLLLERLRLVGV